MCARLSLLVIEKNALKFGEIAKSVNGSTAAGKYEASDTPNRAEGKLGTRQQI